MAKIKFDIPAEEEKLTSITFKLQKSEVELIENYTNFLCEKHKKKIDKEVVLKGLIKPLLKDKEYKEFLNKDSQRVGAVTEANTKTKKSSKKIQTEQKVEAPSV